MDTVDTAVSVRGIYIFLLFCGTAVSNKSSKSFKIAVSSGILLFFFIGESPLGNSGIHGIHLAPKPPNHLRQTREQGTCYEPAT